VLEMDLDRIMGRVMDPIAGLQWRIIAAMKSSLGGILMMMMDQVYE